MTPTRCTINVSFGQYALHDRTDRTDWGEVFEGSDGLLAAAQTGVAVSTGTVSGPVIVDVAVVDQLPLTAPAGVVADRCVIHIPSGIALITNVDGTVSWRAELRPGAWEILVFARGADAAARQAVIAEAMEFHELYLFHRDDPAEIPPS